MNRFQSLYILLLLCTIVLTSQSSTAQSTTNYKNKTVKKPAVKPPSRWMTTHQTEERNKQIQDDTKNKVQVTFVYDTLGNGEKSTVIGFIDKKTNKFKIDTIRTAGNQVIDSKPTGTFTSYSERIPIPEKYTETQGIHISFSKIPNQPTSNYLIDYINNYNQNYGAKLRRLKVSERQKFNVIETILRKNNIPLQMKYLAVIESALNLNAESWVGAVGPWQFMPATARDMNLVVNDRVDQRKDLYKSTYAATKYMKHLYRIFGDWLLVIASYNSGPGPVLAAIRTTGSKNFWVIRNRLPRETRGHVLAFLATAAIMEKLDKFSGLYDLNPINLNLNEGGDVEIEEKKEELHRNFKPNETKNMVVLIIKEPLTSKIVCKRLQLNIEDFDRWNPRFNELVLSKNEYYKMYIPNEKMEGFIDMKYTILNESKLDREEMKNHANKPVQVAEVQATSNRSDKTTNYIVQYGETIDMIANRFGKTVDQIIQLNKLTNYDLLPGDIIRIE